MNESPQAEAAQVRFWLTSTQYLLLSVEYKNKTGPRAGAQEARRLSSLLFTVTVFDEFPPGVSTSDMLVAQLRRLLDDDMVCRLLTPEFRLWVLFLIAMSVTDNALKSWCLTCVAEAVSKLNIYQEEDFTALVSIFPHDPSSHVVSCRLVWDEVMGQIVQDSRQSI
ncbi:hypothetical protein BBP40_005897 [Aspergillus hancockii]|nr:hypothetical protein BBP40_005897 [Aspergillus hancockii]